MKALYWRNNTVSTPQLVVVAVLAAAALFAIERNPVEERDSLYEEKMRAARLSSQMFRAVYLERIRLQIPLDTEFDPAGSGIVGPPHSEIVSNEGHLGSKQTSANPNFAAAFVQMFHEAGVGRNDVVAVSCTGSFPGMNISLYAALQTLGVVPIVVSSVASSAYGATHPRLTWLDMERVIFEADLISFRSVAATMGGVLDIARNHSEEGQEAIRDAIERNERPLMYPHGFNEAVSMRLDLYDEVRAEREVALFVNVGGGTASVGTAEDKHDFSPGLNTRVPHGLERRSVMRTYLEQDVPVIHVSQIRSLARRYGLPDRPVEIPEPGDGSVFTVTGFNRWYIGLALILILAAMFAATRFDVASSLSARNRDKSGPEPMV